MKVLTISVSVYIWMCMHIYSQSPSLQEEHLGDILDCSLAFHVQCV